MILFLAIGLAAGVLSGLFGIGGGIVIVPALLYVAAMPVRTALGTSLGALLLPVGALGAWTYWRAGDLNFRASAGIALGLFIGAYFGAIAAQHVPTGTLRRLFAVFMVIVAVRMWIGGGSGRAAPQDGTTADSVR